MKNHKNEKNNLIGTKCTNVGVYYLECDSLYFELIWWEENEKLDWYWRGIVLKIMHSSWENDIRENCSIGF